MNSNIVLKDVFEFEELKSRIRSINGMVYKLDDINLIAHDELRLLNLEILLKKIFVIIISKSTYK